MLAASDVEFGSALGDGSFGHVMRGLFRGHVEVAIKVKRNRDPRTDRSFRVETAAFVRIPPHANVLGFVGCLPPANPDEAPSIVTRFAHGGTVLDRINLLRRPLNPFELRHILVGCVYGLDHVHRAGLLHCDIKCVPATRSHTPAHAP